MHTRVYTFNELFLYYLGTELPLLLKTRLATENESPFYLLIIRDLDSERIEGKSSF